MELDVRRSDHSGDPVLTFLGAMAEALPQAEIGSGRKAVEALKTYSAIAAKVIAKSTLRAGADELIDRIEAKLDGKESLQTIVGEVGDDLSKAAADLLVGQMAAEAERRKLPDQLQALRVALSGRDDGRVVVVIDELDRCPPDYTIACLEAMRLVFGAPGFVFCLMVNPGYIENLVQHRYGQGAGDEVYLDKFVDLRLALSPGQDKLRAATELLANDLPLAIPFGDHDEFSHARAVTLAGELAVASKLSLRQVKRTLERVELVLRLYAKQPVDLPLLVCLAFCRVTKRKPEDVLPRAGWTPARALNVLAKYQRDLPSVGGQPEGLDPARRAEFSKSMPELLSLPKDRFPYPDDGKNYYPWYALIAFLGPHYIPDHQAMLDAVARFDATD